MSEIETPVCRLELSAEGVGGRCPREGCAFWEPGGRVLDGGCLLERLGVETSNADLAGYLLEVRARLEQARDLAEAEEAHRQFSRRLGRDV